MCGGSRICSRCSGKGYTESWGVVDGTGTGYMVSDDGNAYPVGGSGSSSFRENNSNTYKSQSEEKTKRYDYAPCKGCNGNGKCDYCEGTGKRLSSEYDAVLNRTGKILSNCSICKGTGHCGICFGTGRIAIY